jgi:hypothetical protein
MREAPTGASASRIERDSRNFAALNRPAPAFACTFARFEIKLKPIPEMVNFAQTSESYGIIKIAVKVTPGRT